MNNKLLSLISPEQLIQDFKELGSATKIAKKYKINPVTVYSAFKLIGFDCIVKPRVDENLTKDLLQKEYNELQSFRKIGKKYNASGESIRMLSEKFGVETNDLVRYACDEDFFTQENETTFYVAGFIAADGCVKIRKGGASLRYELQIGLAKTDKEFLNQIKITLKTDAPIHDFLIENSKRNPNWNDTWASQLQITSKKIVNDLEKFDIVPRKSLIYTFPKWMIEHPLRHHYMRGYFDGDGSFYVPKLAEGKHTEQIYFGLRGTQQFLKCYRSILEQECELEVRDKNIRISSDCGVLEYGGNGVISEIAQFLYCDATIFLPRKKEIIQHLI